jgi:hypothetical protein
MTSEVGIVKIGIADDPLIRMIGVKKQYPIITGFYQAWGMPRRQAEFVERMVHRRLAAFHHKNELFRMTEEDAVKEIEIVINTLDITAAPFMPLPPREKKVRKKPGRRSAAAPVVFTMRIDTALRDQAKLAAKAEDRSLTNWIQYLMACEIAALERGEPPVSIYPDDDITSDPRQSAA